VASHVVLMLFLLTEWSGFVVFEKAALFSLLSPELHFFLTKEVPFWREKVLEITVLF
jgi:hypothetical protein